jgi:hypothetical protein
MAKSLGNSPIVIEDVVDIVHEFLANLCDHAFEYAMNEEEEAYDEVSWNSSFAGNVSPQEQLEQTPNRDDFDTANWLSIDPLTDISKLAILRSALTIAGILIEEAAMEVSLAGQLVAVDITVKTRFAQSLINSIFKDGLGSGPLPVSCTTEEGFLEYIHDWLTDELECYLD